MQLLGRKDQQTHHHPFLFPSQSSSTASIPFPSQSSSTASTKAPSDTQEGSPTPPSSPFLLPSSPTYSSALPDHIPQSKPNKALATLVMASVDAEGGNRRKRPRRIDDSAVGDARYISWLVPVFVVLNVAVFVVTMYLNNCPAHARGGSSKCVATVLRRFSFQPLRQNPLLGPSSRTLQKMGALQWDKVVNHNQGWRLVTFIWLHAGVIHLVVNTLSLTFIGIRLEQQFGFLRIGSIYLISGFGGSILSSLLVRNIISVGASGPLFGLLGAMLSELITNWTIYSNKVAALFTLLVVVLINLAVGILPHVNNLSNIGGFLSGFLLGFILLIRPQLGWMERHNLPSEYRSKTRYKMYQKILQGAALILLIACFAVGLVMLFKGENVNDWCHWCHYLSCVPTSIWKCGN